jgi:hypothetical protein
VEQERLELTMKEIDRLRVIHKVIDGDLKAREAGSQLGLSVRQVRRLKKKVTRSNHGIIHGLRGRPSNHLLDPELVKRAVELVKCKYSDFGPTFANEKLCQEEGIRISTNTLRKAMITAGLWKIRRQKITHRVYRERRACLGELVQLDGSDHRWFEKRANRCVLLNFIDDATSKILHAEFVQAEDTLTLLAATRRYLVKRGRPIAFYVDRDSIYKVNREQTIEEQLRDLQPMTQFTRAMKELDIEVIAANSPQAKGRVERSFKTHQDRLVKELRLNGISTMEQANKFLSSKYIPANNRRFSVQPQNRTDAHRPLLPIHSLAKILSIRLDRTVRNDYTVRFNNLFMQILPAQKIRPSQSVLVEIRLDGSIHLRFKQSYLQYKFIDKPVLALGRRLPEKMRKLQKKPKPDENHPWRNFFITPKAAMNFENIVKSPKGNGGEGTPLPAPHPKG